LTRQMIVLSRMKTAWSLVVVVMRGTNVTGKITFGQTAMIHAHQVPPWDSDKLPWDCSEVREEPLCSNDDENCMETGCCNREGYTCFRKNDYWAKCTFECTPGESNILDPQEHREPWSCDIIEMPCNESATPAELLACCKSFACADFADVELCALDKCGYYAAALLNATAVPLAVKSASAAPTAVGSTTTT